MKKKLLYLGAFFKGSTALHRMDAVKEAGWFVIGLDTQIGSGLASILFRGFRKLGFDIDFHRINDKVRRICAEQRIDIIWVDKGWFLKSETVLILKKKYPDMKVVHYSPDDMLNPGNQTSIYRRAIPVYDLHVTTKSFNVSELKAMGAKEAFFVSSSFQPHVHRPLTEKNRLAGYLAEVSFAGALEIERARSIRYLAENGIKVTVWTGSNWRRYFDNHPNIVIRNGWFAEDEYTKIICGAKIVLCFLRKANRDLHTQRSVEIPACGAFMIGERTEEHLRMFVEGKEAEFFSSDKELLEKVRYYLMNDQRRAEVAKNGRERCLSDGYDNLSMVKRVLSHIYGS